MQIEKEKITTFNGFFFSLTLYYSNSFSFPRPCTWLELDQNNIDFLDNPQLENLTEEENEKNGNNDDGMRKRT